MQCSVSFFCPPFQRLWSCSLYFVPQSARTTTTFIKPKQEQSFHRSLRSCLTSFTLSFLHLPCPQKNYTARQKHTPALRFQRRLSEPSLQIAHSFLISLFSVLAIPASHLRSTRYRLAPLTTASRESTSLRFAAFPLAFVRLRAALPARFSASPSHSPRPPTPKEFGS